ncbi:hypothetical protein CDAR_574691 [Caerostris darwini]|uniref:Reverse transcriptase domain-containing protein n=1 Tax=Caerostris darwini TaxID=1538125 RepID=A0AAV4NIA2_9ARAC|nr:hypothetical protein CDAR_574691 [Caerostris darwini]
MSNDENEVNMVEDPQITTTNGPQVTPQNATGPRPLSPSGVHVSEEFVKKNIEFISELHAFQNQLEHLHNCMQAASSSDKDVKLVAQTNALVQKVELISNLVKINEAISTARSVECGLLQVSILSPLLFNIDVNDFPKDPLVHTAIYADDTAHTTSSPFHHHV